MEDGGNKTSQPAQMILVLRLVAGVYLVYLAVGLIKDAAGYSGTRQMVLYLCTVVFFVVGAVLAGWTLKKLVKGEYAGGRAS
jgi:threonine/homoserine/homoserine lactone efflux protein